MDFKQESSDEKIIFAPFEEIRCVEKVIDKLEKIRFELNRILEGMRPVEN